LTRRGGSDACSATCSVVTNTESDNSRPDLPISVVETPLDLVPSLIVLLVGLAITAALCWTAWTLNADNESRLLNLQAKQVASVLKTAIPTAQTPLELGAEVAQATNGDVAKFTQYMSNEVGSGREFSSVGLWHEQNGAVQQLTRLGNALDPATPTDATTLIEKAFRSSTFAVAEVISEGHRVLAYSVALPGSDREYAVYAERPLPKDRRAAVASDSAFSDLKYAIYLGNSVKSGSLLATDFTTYPIPGPNVTVHVPFGDNALTTVVAANTPLGGSLSAQLPWIVLTLGVILSMASAMVTMRLVSRRRTAEVIGSQTRQLYDELGALYGQQRTIAETLQRALLPSSLPEIPGLAVAVRFVPGARGVEIGGDWYSVVALEDGRFFFVIGDVSGRGLSAASIMARLRFTIRAYALDGDSPTEILEKCVKQLDISVDGHFATVLVGIGDVDRNEVTLANAGHLRPFLLSDDCQDYLVTPTGPPLGVGPALYESTTYALAPNSTLVAFTDGLIERRGENLDVGFARLSQALSENRDAGVEDLIDSAIAELSTDSSDDDLAILVLRWLRS
jgi:serine phosphatase RsbU (regulator of sigma subunit)